jgi:hypothetical protein
MDSWPEVANSSTWVEGGTTNGNSAWFTTANLPGGTLGTTSINWIKYYSVGQYQDASAILASLAALLTDGVLYKTGTSVAARTIATAAEIWNGTLDRIVDTTGVLNAGLHVTLPAISAGVQSVSLTTGRNFSMTATSNFTLANPTGVQQGWEGEIKITQGAGGPYTVIWGTQWLFEAPDPALTATVGAIDYLEWKVDTSTRIRCRLHKNPV